MLVVWMSSAATPSDLMRATTLPMASAFCRMASTAVGAITVTPALTVAISGLAFTLSVTLSSTTGPADWIWISAAAAGAAIAPSETAEAANNGMA